MRSVAPVSAMVAAIRQLFGNDVPSLAASFAGGGMPAGAVPTESLAWSLQHPVIYSLIWVVLIGAIGLALAVWRYSRGGNR